MNPPDSDAHADEEKQIADAVRWLHRSYRVGALVDAVATVGMAVPQLYGPTLRFSRRFRRTGPEFAYALRTGAPLMAGWTALLLWADRRPLERRDVLPLTIAPVLAGLIANDAQAVRAGQLSRGGVTAVRILQLGLGVLFGYSYLKARRAVAGTRPHISPRAGPHGASAAHSAAVSTTE